MDHLCLVFLMLSRLFIAVWIRADLLALVGDDYCILCFTCFRVYSLLSG